MKKTMLVIAAAGLTLPMAAPAAADPPRWAPAHGKRAKDAQRHYQQRYAQQSYQPRYYTSNQGTQYWAGDDGRYYCKRSNGTTGLLIGAAGGALLGRTILSGGDRTLGTVVGAAAGALLGRQLDRGEVRCR